MQLNACETNIMLNDVHVAVSLQISTRPQVLCMCLYTLHSCGRYYNDHI